MPDMQTLSDKPFTSALTGPAVSDSMDLAILSELAGDDRKRMRDFLLKFIEFAEEDISRIEEASERKDMAALSRLGHHAKAPANMVGAMKIRDLCQLLESMNGSVDFKQAGDIVSQLRPQLSLVRAILDKNLL